MRKAGIAEGTVFNYFRTKEDYRKVYPLEIERDDEPFDFGGSPVVHDYLRESKKLVNSRGALSEHVFLARAEMGLYDTLHRLRARVHTSRIVRRYLKN